MSTRVVSITGATGLLGGALCRRFAREGWGVRALSRRPVTGAGSLRWFECDLPDVVPAGAFEGCGVVVHAAYTTRSRGRAHDARVNLEGSRRVLEAARRAGVERYVFVSSISAHEHAEGRYGQSKLVLERELDPARDLAIRPGLILARGAGLFDRMARVARGVGVVPMFGGGRQIIQTIHLDDLVQGFVLAITKGCTGTFTLCEPEGLPMRDLFGLMGRLSGRRIRVVPLPFGPALMALGACEWMGLRLPVSADNLRGLRSMRHQDSRASLERLGLGVRTAEESLRDLLGRGAGA